MKAILSRELAAKSLDLTHAIDDRGPKTYQARQRVAKWLDCGGKVTTALRLDVARLLNLAR